MRCGELGDDQQRWIESLLGQLPLRVTRKELRERLYEHRQWYIEQLMEGHKLTAAPATEQTDATLDALLAGWRDPTLRGRPAQDTSCKRWACP